MKKILLSLMVVAFFISAQVAFGDQVVVDITLYPEIPIFEGGPSNQPAFIEVPFYYEELPGDIKEASITIDLANAKNIKKLLKMDLYLDDIFLIDFKEYYNSLSKSEQKALKKDGVIYIDLTELGISSEDLEDLLEALEDDAILSFVGKQKLFSGLIDSAITLYILDDVLPNGTPVPEPTTMLLLGAGLIGLWGLRKRMKK